MNLEKMRAALEVVARTPHIREYLTWTDPKALAQVDAAVGLNGEGDLGDELPPGTTAGDPEIEAEALAALYESAAEEVAVTIARTIAEAGHRDGEPNDVDTRAERLLRVGYVRPGPSGWGGPNALCIITCEPMGGCEPPWRYGFGDLDAQYEVSDHLDGLYIESINAAVAGVYRV